MHDFPCRLRSAGSRVALRRGPPSGSACEITSSITGPEDLLTFVNG